MTWKKQAVAASVYYLCPIADLRAIENRLSEKRPGPPGMLESDRWGRGSRLVQWACFVGGF